MGLGDPAAADETETEGFLPSDMLSRYKSGPDPRNADPEYTWGFTTE